MKFPGEWKIVKVNPRTVKLSQDGRAQGLNADKSLVTFTQPNGGVVVSDVRFPFEPGTVVKWNAPKGAGKLFVVFSDDGLSYVTRIVQLGGGAAWRRVPARALEVVKIDDINQ